VKVKQKIKGFWKYLNTSHGKHLKVIPYEDYGYTSIPHPFIQVPNRTPLEKIIRTGIVIGILGGICLLGRVCVKVKERAVPDPYALKIYVGIKEDALNDIEWAKKHLGEKHSKSSIEIAKYRIESSGRMIADYRKRIKEKIEKGYLTPKHRYWNDYEKYFGEEDWWPKEVNN